MTNLIALRSIDEFYKGYKPAYSPILPLFTGSAVKYSVDAGSVNFRQANAVGDIRSKLISPKDTEMHQILANEGSKTFKKYFLGSQFIQSQLQDVQGYEDVVGQVLDEHNKQSDELFITGEGTANNNVVNNGLYFSGDANYVTNGSYEVQKDTNGNYLVDLYGHMIGQIQNAQNIDGRLLVILYGSTVTPVYNGLFPSNSVPFLRAIGDAADGVSFAKLPSAVTPAGANGYIIVNLDQVRLHYTLLPEVWNQGVNEEKLYAWTNFLMGSSMLEVQAYGAVTRQPLTLEA